MKMRIKGIAGMIVLLTIGFMGLALTQKTEVINLGADPVLAKLSDADFRAYYYPSKRTFDIGIRIREGNSIKSR